MGYSELFYQKQKKNTDLLLLKMSLIRALGVKQNIVVGHKNRNNELKDI